MTAGGYADGCSLIVGDLEARAREANIEPIQAPLFCPSCKKQHCDESEWSRTPHKVHRCVDDCFGAGCGHEWQPFLIASYGVRVI